MRNLNDLDENHNRNIIVSITNHYILGISLFIILKLKWVYSSKINIFTVVS